MVSRRTLLGGTAAAILAPVAARPARSAQAPGITDTEIKFGNTYAYSGPASAYSVIAKAETAMFQKINDEGGINGRKLNFLSYDDGYSPPKTVEQTRRLVEQDGVAFLFNPLGTASNTAIWKYCNQKKVPQLFVSSGADKWGDYQEHPWTIGWAPSYRTEAQIYAKYILQTKPDGKIGLLYQNDDFGKDYYSGLKDILGDRFDKTVTAVTYEITDPTIDSQVVALKTAGCDVFVSATTPKFAAMTIRKVADLAWKPLYINSFVSSSVGAVIHPAGPEHAVGIISSAYSKDPTDPGWANDAGMKEWHAFMTKYLPDADATDLGYVSGYSYALTMIHVLRACGNDLSRENIMRQATSLHGLQLPSVLPGITLNTSPTDYRPIKKLSLMRWTGTKWERFGELIDSTGT
jgi:branched-chain amino acid transport system substrate-binding protein